MSDQDERASTYLDQARARIDLESGRGRWANPSPYVVGSQPTVNAPVVGSHWAAADSAIEPPLGPLDDGDLRSS
jgi:hypothetical protein